MNKFHRKQVIIAMSGGVDSSVAAVLLKKQGYEVTGLHLRLFNDGKKEKQVKKIARIIGIPLVVEDVQKEFKKKVIDYFLREYKAGRTPNPCVVCNQEIKFKFLFDELAKLEADYIATGHYARIMKHETCNMKQNIYKLFEANDKTKDQSYFLYTLTQKQLEKIIFPLGNYRKEEVKKMAEKYNLIRIIDKNNLHLPSADGKCRYKESQNVCFIPEKYPDDFLKKRIKMKPGKIVDAKGNIIGQHGGLPLYTLGQRRGINIGGTGPYYVVKKDEKRNMLIVTNKKNDPALFKKEAFLENVKWVSNKSKMPVKVLVRNRYRDPLNYAKIEIQNTIYKIRYTRPQRAITPGQSAVFYTKKGEVLGGGIIR